MDKESLCAEFPDTWEEFIEKWAYNVEVQDEDNYDFQVKPVIDVYRVKQMMWYYLRDYIKLGIAYSSDNYTINIVPDETKNLAQGIPHFVIRRQPQW